MGITIRDEDDLITARKLVREAAAQAGFDLTDTTRLVTAASELARNILQYAGLGTMECTSHQGSPLHGVELLFADEGPGIADISLAMQPGFTTSVKPSLGLGLPGVKRLVDEMEVNSQVGHGTTIRICKWLTRKPTSHRTATSI